MKNQMTTVEFLKNLFYKTCFCIGLGTASYYSYGQVQNWVSAPNAVTSQASVLQEKVDQLSSPSTEIAQVKLGMPTAAPETGGYRANTRLYLIGSKKTAAVTTSAPADPSASPSAIADKDKKEGDVAAKDGDKKDGEKKEGEETKTEEGAVANAPTGPVNALGLPYYPAPGFEAAANPNAAGTPAPAAGATNPSLVSGGIPTPPGGTSEGTSDDPVTAGTTGSTSSGASTASSGTTLSAAEISQLTGTTIAASFTDSTENVSGLLCSLGANGTSEDNCVQNNQYPVHTDRWNVSYGLSSTASFSIASTSTSSQIQVSVTLKVQDVNNNYQSISAAVNPTEVTTQSETKNGIVTKTYDLRLPDITGLNGEKLTNVMATLIYTQSATASTTSTLSSESAMTFTRSNVETTGSAWSSTGQSRGPAANEQVIVANSLTYTMNLEKSP